MVSSGSTSSPPWPLLHESLFLVQCRLDPARTFSPSDPTLPSVSAALSFELLWLAPLSSLLYHTPAARLCILSGPQSGLSRAFISLVYLAHLSHHAQLIRSRPQPSSSIGRSVSLLASIALSIFVGHLYPHSQHKLPPSPYSATWT